MDSLQPESAAGKSLPVDPLVGQIVDGKYRVISKIGGGGMGAVYKAEHITVERSVALKVIHKRLIEEEDGEFFLRFQREAKTTGKLKHPNAIAVFDFGVVEGLPYLVMDYVEGETLKQVLTTCGALPAQRVVHIVEQICDALAAAHAMGIIHRDLKPDNIMLTRKHDGSDWVQVLDFGIAKVIGQEGDELTQLTQTGRIMGTPQYMSPEQVRAKPIDHRSDIYSLGIILYEMISGKVPFSADSVGELIIQHAVQMPKPMREFKPELNIPAPLDSIVLKALAKEPAERQQSALELCKSLRAALNAQGSTTQRDKSEGPTTFAHHGTDTRTQHAATGWRISENTPADTLDSNPVTVNRWAMTIGASVCIAALCLVVGYATVRESRFSKEKELLKEQSRVRQISDEITRAAKVAEAKVAAATQRSVETAALQEQFRLQRVAEQEAEQDRQRVAEVAALQEQLRVQRAAEAKRQEQENQQQLKLAAAAAAESKKQKVPPDDGVMFMRDPTTGKNARYLLRNGHWEPDKSYKAAEAPVRQVKQESPRKEVLAKQKVETPHEQAKSFNRYPMAVAAFCLSGGSDASNTAAQVIKNRITKSISGHKYLSLLNEGAYITNKPVCDGQSVVYSDWSVIGAGHLITGHVKQEGSAFIAELFLFDVEQQRVVLGKRYQFSDTDTETVASRFIGEVNQFFTGSREIK